jgi:hypothetical protein
MKITDVIYITVIPALSFYGAVYDNKLSIEILEVQAFIMLVLCLIGFYHAAFADDETHEFMENYDISESGYGTWKQKIGYLLIIASACLLISYDHVLLGLFIIVPIFVNEYVAHRIIDANQQKA